MRARTVSTDRYDTDSLQTILATELPLADNNTEIRWRDGNRFEPYLQTAALPMTEGIETALADTLDPTRPVVNLAQRTGVPDDMAKAVLFMVSTDSDFVWGENLFLDGGTMAMEIT